MAISGHKTRAVFDRHHIVDETDELEAMRKVQIAVAKKSDGPVSESSVRVKPVRARLKR
jgi:hypothetical protein